MSDRLVYLDNNASTQPAPEAVEAMQPFFSELWGNPSSMHFFGGQVARYVETAREKLAAMIHADPSEIVFTSCGTESDNMALNGVAEMAGKGMRVITSRVEHPAVLGACRHLRENGHQVVELAVDGVGQLDIAALREALYGAPCLVSIMWANNETGVIFPIDEIAALVKSMNGIMHTDAVQVFGKLPIDVRRTPVDLLSLSGHKIHAPKGIGALYIRRGTRLKTYLIGGHQEHGRRGGTENVPYIVALGKATELMQAHMPEDATRMAKLRDRLEAGLLKTCADSRINGDTRHRLPNTSNMSFEFIEGEAILYHLSDLGICASSGSACSSGSLEPSHVIRAMGVPFTAAHGSIRFSLSRYTTDADIDYVLQNMPGIVKKLRAISPFVQKK
jgi:cysteine desulfurase